MALNSIRGNKLDFKALKIKDTEEDEAGLPCEDNMV